MKKRSHADPASTAVVIQPRHSLGGKQASRDAAASSDDVSFKKRLSCDTVHGPAPPLPLPPPPAMPTIAMTHAPPLHPHHLSAYGSHNSNYGGTNVGRGNSVLLARATSGGSAAALLANTHDILLSAMLMKRAPFFKHWVPRFFCLTKSSLVYYSKNPSFVAAAQGSEASHKDLAAIEKRLLRGEISRGDVLRVEAVDTFRNHPHSFAIVARKRPRVRGAGRSALACMFVHHKETRLSTKKKKTSSGSSEAGGAAGGDTESDGAIMTYYIQAPKEEDRKKWIKTLERWIDGESPAKLGRAIFEYIVNNEYSASKYEHKVGEPTGSSDVVFHGGGCGVSQVSPAAQAGRRIEEEHAVLANLIRDMHECHQEDEMIFILDQIVGEVKDGACSGYVKKLIAAAGEVKLETASAVWTTNVKAAYGAIMKALYTQRKAAAELCDASAASQVQAQAYTHGKGASSSRSSMLRPTLLKPTRQTSDGGESAPEFSFHRAYKLGRKLGSGAYSVVHIATHRSTRKQVAVKCIAKSSLSLSDVVSLKHEVDIMRTLNHPNVVPLLDYYEEPRYYYIVTPLCTGGELFDALVKRKSYTEEDARGVMLKITHAITYFHSRGVVHRDLKPENILLKTSAPGAEVMIADFGFARAQKRGEKRLTACGTPGYVAPEVVRGEAYGAEVDCWSLGVILYILLCGYPPFRGENHVAIFEKVVAAQYKFESPDWDDVSFEAKDLVRKLLTVDRSQRLTAAQVLEHAWLNPGRVPQAPNVPEAKRLVRVSSDLISALSQMRKHSLTHDLPKIRPSDMDVDLLELTRESIELDVDLLDRELSNLDF